MAGGGPAGMRGEVAEEACGEFGVLSEGERELVVETLRWDGRPAFHDEEGRRYHLRVSDLEVGWEVRAGVCRGVGVRRGGGD